MHLILHLPAELEAKLCEQARHEGKALEEVALEALEERLSLASSAEPILPLEEWTKAFEAWVQRHNSRNPAVDDSRESIYPDRS